MMRWQRQRWRRRWLQKQKHYHRYRHRHKEKHWPQKQIRLINNIVWTAHNSFVECKKSTPQWTDSNQTHNQLKHYYSFIIHNRNFECSCRGWVGIDWSETATHNSCILHCTALWSYKTSLLLFVAIELLPAISVHLTQLHIIQFGEQQWKPQPIVKSNPRKKITWNETKRNGMEPNGTGTM